VSDSWKNGEPLSKIILVTYCFAALLCLIPLSFYLSWLTLVNKRAMPTLIAGTWDFARTVAGLAGFILIGGLFVLELIQPESVVLVRGNFAQMQETLQQSYWKWLLTSFGFLTVVLGGFAWEFSRRRRSFSVYNIDPLDWEHVLARVLERLGGTMTRKGSMYVDQHGGQIEVIVSPGFHFVSVRMLKLSAEREADFPRILGEELRSVSSGDAPYARWFSALSTGFVALVVAILLLAFYVMFF
jgi:hypothetical protein